MTVQQFRKKPVVIEAVRWVGTNSNEIAAFAGKMWIEMVAPNPGDDLIIDTPEGKMRCRLGDWLIRGVAGELYPCKPAIFEATYEAVGPS